MEFKGPKPHAFGLMPHRIHFFRGFFKDMDGPNHLAATLPLPHAPLPFPLQTHPHCLQFPHMPPLFLFKSPHYREAATLGITTPNLPPPHPSRKPTWQPRYTRVGWASRQRTLPQLLLILKVSTHTRPLQHTAVILIWHLLRVKVCG